MDNFYEFTMLDSDLLTKYIGFTEAEVIDLCQEYQMDFSEMKNWYDGYCLDDEAHVYNPKCVIDTIWYGEIGNYWRRDDMLHELVHLEYLTYDRKTKEVYIPNEEVRVAYRNMIEDFEGSLFETAVDANPFYSESNIRYLEKKMKDYKAGRLKLVGHE